MMNRGKKAALDAFVASMEQVSSTDDTSATASIYEVGTGYRIDGENLDLAKHIDAAIEAYKASIWRYHDKSAYPKVDDFYIIVDGEWGCLYVSELDGDPNQYEDKEYVSEWCTDFPWVKDGRSNNYLFTDTVYMYAPLAEIAPDDVMDKIKALRKR